MNSMIGEIIGIICCTCTTLAFLPQAIKSIITKNVSGLSLTMYIIYCSGLVFWILYGIYLQSLQMIISDTITLLFSSIILFMIIKSRFKHK
ncbi:MAG: SemiSWEET transporter [Alphaproteobacteria bacterium]|nr:SemiSWEET transporter [Alphaproteobacteria bacterium]